MIYKNPIIPGFYPDPSIIRVGKDYYLVTSTFEYFPGVPVFHSTDLINWKQIGHCLTRPSQLLLKNAPSSGGIYAPTIRYNDSTFYMVTTNTTGGGNFYVYTNDPNGEWSEPIWVDQGGIDPSLLFDGDKVYFTSNGPEGIYMCELDIKTCKKLTETTHIWRGTGGRYAEAPHLYKINDMYYLMIAEGGTEYGHMETIARSTNPYGPYEPCPHNPILTHRNRGGHPIQGTGHADLVEDDKGNWWLVFLAFRPSYFMYHHTGRETYLAPVEWKDGWPIVNKNGTVELEINTDKIDVEQKEFTYDRDDFDTENLKLCWNFLRNPHKEDWSLSERKGYLTLHGSEINLDQVDSPAFVGRRQQHMNSVATVFLDFEPVNEGEEAGLTAFMNEKHHYDIAVALINGEKKIIVRRRIGSLVCIVAEANIPVGPVQLVIDADNLNYHFGYKTAKEVNFIANGECHYLSSEVAGGFTGVYYGIYATGNGRRSSVPAYFDWFEYRVK